MGSEISRGKYSKIDALALDCEELSPENELKDQLKDLTYTEENDTVGAKQTYLDDDAHVGCDKENQQHTDTTVEDQSQHQVNTTAACIIKLKGELVSKLQSNYEMVPTTDSDTRNVVPNG